MSPKKYTCNRCGYSFNNKHGSQCPICYVESHSIRYSEGTKEAELEEYRRKEREREEEYCEWGRGDGW